MISTLFLLIQVFGYASCQDILEAQVNQLCNSLDILTCDQCIKAHPACSWCAVAVSNTQVKRCRSDRQLINLEECPQDQIYRPNSTVTLLNNSALSEPGTSVESSVVQLQPQNIQINIRKGGQAKFNITFRKVTDYPVDLYYLMDLSHSMLDDLEKLKELGKNLAKDIQSSITKNIQMGFGTFVDKVMKPYASTIPDQLRNPCVKNQSPNNHCSAPFGFKHQQSISANLTNFENSVNSTTISGNIDSPEGGFDALMQIAVCTDEIGWRADATHLVVITTDASFHMALDGKLAGILKANDMKCHLTKGANTFLPDDTVYDKSKILDYPSIGQLRSVFKDYKIQPIFAVTKDVRNLYEELKQLIPNSFVDELAADSSNIISIIKAAYNQLRGKLDMSLDDNLPPEITMNYRVLCPNATKWKSNSLSCDLIQIGSEVIYEFDMSATDCPKHNLAKPLTFTSSSLQEDVKIYFNFLCACSCSNTPEIKSRNCSENGSLTCGACDCDSSHEGAYCQCTRNEKDVSLVEKCKKSGSTDDICEGNGHCECGNCTCNEGYDGNFCECSNKGCPTSNNGICGGADQGACKNCDGNARCECKNSWTLHHEIQTCTCHKDLCKANISSEVLCSHNGDCDCNRCACFNQSAFYSGEFCEVCVNPKCKPPTGGCQGTTMRSCAQCVNDAQRLRENKNEKCLEQCGTMDYVLVGSIPNCKNCFDDTCKKSCSDIDINIIDPQVCQALLADSDCSMHYDIVWRRSTNDYQLIVKEFSKDQDCPKPINILIIVLPIVAGVVLLGLITLIVWKIFQTIRDKHEWKNFENEKKQSKWTKGQNPIFTKPSTRFENPIYLGNS